MLQQQTAHCGLKAKSSDSWWSTNTQTQIKERKGRNGKTDVFLAVGQHKERISQQVSSFSTCFIRLEPLELRNKNTPTPNVFQDFLFRHSSVNIHVLTFVSVTLIHFKFNSMGIFSWVHLHKQLLIYMISVSLIWLKVSKTYFTLTDEGGWRLSRVNTSCEKNQFLLLFWMCVFYKKWQEECWGKRCKIVKC